MGCLTGLMDWIRRLFSEADGVTPSSTRVLMYIFALFSIWLDWRIFYHIFRISDSTQLNTWLANLPMLIGAEIGLIALPYTINKSTNTLSDVANMFSAIKNGTAAPVNAALSNISVQGATQKAAAPKVGTKGPKG